MKKEKSEQVTNHRFGKWFSQHEQSSVEKSRLSCQCCGQQVAWVHHIAGHTSFHISTVKFESKEDVAELGGAIGRDGTECGPVREL